MRTSGRIGPRLAAAAALLAVAAALVLVLASSGGDGDGHREANGPRAQLLFGESTQQPAPGLGAAAVRNATPQPSWVAYRGPVPIFRWHAVGAPAAGEPFPELWVEPADFEAQMRWLAAHGYEAVGLETVERAWAGAGTLPRKPVVLSFDSTDGDLGSVVFPDLSRRGWPGVVVLDAEAPLARRPLLRRLLAAGWEVEAEGRDAAGAGPALEAKLAAPVANFSFRRGDSEDADPRTAEAAGYAGATVVGPGFASRSDRYAMPRITVYGLSRVEGFAEAVRSRGEGAGA